MSAQGLKKILWSVNVLEEPESQKSMLALLGAVTRAAGARIEPVFVLSPPYAQVVGTPKADFEQAYLTLAEKRLALLKQECGITAVEDAHILINRQGSIRKDVEMIVSYAHECGADAIAVATHGRRGATRLFMGSFAETLILLSDLPIFTINPQVQVHEKIRKILLPTDFLPQSESVFEKAVTLAKTFDASLTLFYKEPFLPSAMLNPEIYAYIAQEAEGRRAKAGQWQARAAKSGVHARILLDDQPGYLTEALDRLVAVEGFDLIAMGTQADRTTAILAGSAARQTVRQAACPVWVTRINEVR